MPFEPLTIAQADDPKGRTFTVHLVASIEVPQLLPPASNGTKRPVLLAYASSTSAVRAFTANLRSGYPAAHPRWRVELLRSSGYRYQTLAPMPGSSLVLAYLPSLFHLQPAAQDDGRIAFVAALPTWWLDAQEALLAPEWGADARDVARASAFVARLDARTPLPIANDPAFHLALYRRALEEPWIETEGTGARVRIDGLEALGLDAPVVCDVAPAAFAEFLAQLTAELLPRQACGRLVEATEALLA